MPLTFRFAMQQDFPQVVDLVNAAYRGDENYPGWTHEGHLIDGARISLQQLNQQLSEPQVQMLLAIEKEGALEGCMMLSNQDQKVYLGTFAVQPQRQGGGIGRQMLQQAETLARQEWGAKKMEMVVISQRQDLIDYYQRRGYQIAATGDAFPVELDVGIPKTDALTLTTLSKSL